MGASELVLAVIASGAVGALINALSAQRGTRRTLQAQAELSAARSDTDRRLALDNLLFGERSKAYVDAVRLLEQGRNLVVHAPDSQSELAKVDEKFPPSPPLDVVTRLTVYGSRDAAETFCRSYTMFRDALEEAVLRNDMHRRWTAQEVEYSEIEDFANRKDRASSVALREAEEHYAELIGAVQRALQA